MRVSVICPVFNTPPALLRDAARSVLDEPTGGVTELLLVDDASTNPDTLAALSDLAREPRVRLLRALANGGPAHARNRGLQAAIGDWIGFLDADDLWKRDHLVRMQSVLAAHPDAGWIAANHETLDRAGALHPSALLSMAHPGARLGPDLVRYQGQAGTRALIGNFWLHLGGMVVRTDIAHRIGGFSETSLYGEDWLFCVCASAVTDLYYVETPSYTLRRQHDSLTTSPQRLSGRRANAKRAALALPMLQPYRRELRWALHSTWKGLAANNLLAGNRLRALGFAARAFAMDPRALGELVKFMKLATMRDVTRLRQALPGYSQAELGVPR